MNLSENLKKIRKDNNLSQEDLAEKLGVSRQSVSKWESGIAYPEMDKVLELCKIFNLNIDELLNQDIKEVEQNRVAQSSISKYIDSFLSYISKTINLLSSMKFKSLVKCIFEQLLLVFVFFILSAILGEVLQSVFSNIFTYLPYSIYRVIFNIFDGVYKLFAFIAIIVIMLHIFKVRYLDYYTVVDKEKKEETNEEKEEVKELKKDNSKIVERKEEKIIIRDPEHSGYKFINGLAKVVIFFIKCFIGFIGIGFAVSLIGFVICFVLSFLISNSGLLFVGTLIGFFSAITINIIILDIIISFIFNRKVKKGLMIIVFLVSLILVGISCGLILSSYKDFKLINEFDEKYYSTKEVTYKMNKDLRISWGFNDIEYVETKNNDVRIEYQFANYCSIYTYNSNNVADNYVSCLNSPDLFKNLLKDLNDKVIVGDDYYVKVYTNKDNIKTLKNNEIKYLKSNEE